MKKVEIIETEKSDGDATVLVEGLKQGIIKGDKPVLFTYTDDVGYYGDKDYSSLITEYKKLKDDLNVSVITHGYVATKEETREKTWCIFFQMIDGKSFRVVEKPDINKLNAALGDKNEVMTNIGKTLFTPTGLQEIASRLGDPVKEDTLKKMTMVYANGM
ncbi:MAG: hypothetical protein L6V95_01895 [Candidatus Melainabacteria bacterium]|nr:MAG: hypothetical protein L6V95_01895 [Candidatus Melainabacteria bacterium]